MVGLQVVSPDARCQVTKNFGSIRFILELTEEGRGMFAEMSHALWDASNAPSRPVIYAITSARDFIRNA